MHPLTDAIWSFDEDAEDEKCEQDIARLVDLLDAEPAIDAQSVIGTLTKDLGTVLPRTVPLIRQANSKLTKRPPIEIAPIVASVQSVKLDFVVKMEQIVSSSAHLHRVLRAPWFEQLRAIIVEWDPATTFEL